MKDPLEIYDDPVFLQNALRSLPDEELQLISDTIVKIGFAVFAEQQSRTLALMPKGNEIVH